MSKLLLAISLALLTSGCNWPIDVKAVTSDGDVFTGTVMGGTTSGSMNLTNGKGVDCVGQYNTNVGFLSCNDGERAQIQYTTVRIGVGYGFGMTSKGRMLRFTFGMSEAEGAAYLGVAAASGAGGASVSSAKAGSGTGFFITRQGHVLTNAPVVDGCKSITVQQPGNAAAAATAAATDKQNDLALLQTGMSPPAVAALRSGRSIRPGEPVVAYGFPLSGIISSGGVLTTGVVNALSGRGDDTRFLQISAPLQPGNSGGPLLDMTAAVIGVTSTSLSTNRAAQAIGATPQNVNFAIKTDVVRTFLSTTGVSAESSAGGRELSAADVGDRARAFTVHIECK